MLTHFCITQQGEKSIKRDKPCQDYSGSRRIRVDKLDSDFVIAAIADGVGSCEYSQLGAQTAVENLLDVLKKGLCERTHEINDSSVKILLEHGFQISLDRVEAVADDMELPFTEFDSTLTAVVYNGSDLWFGHIGDDGLVALYTDGSYEMLTKRHKGEEANSVFPLRNSDLWQFGRADKPVAACALMTDGVLDYCVDFEVMHNRIYFPFLEPAFINPIASDGQAEIQRKAWDDYMSGAEEYPEKFRDSVTDDITFVVVQNSDLVSALPEVGFDSEKWKEDSARRKKEVDDTLYADFRAYKARQRAKIEKHGSDSAVQAATEEFPDSAIYIEPEGSAEQ